MKTILIPYQAETETLAPLPVTITPATHIVVTPWGWDEPAYSAISLQPQSLARSGVF